MDMQIIIPRLAFAKYLIQKGNQEAQHSEPLSSVAILNYHDALELAFDLILEDKEINSKKLSFMEYFDKTNEWLKNNGKTEIGLRPSLEKLKNLRVNIKHKGLFPSKMDIQESEFTVKALFEELCKNVYDLNVDDISLINLIENERVRNYLSEATEQYLVDQKASIENLSLAFEFLLKDYESSKAKFPTMSPFYFGKDMSFYRGGSVDPFSRFKNDTQESIETIKKVLKILAFGLNYNKYIKFRLLIPETEWYGIPTVPHVHLSENTNITQFDLQFCINYIIECALKLQEFDFEISKKEEEYEIQILSQI